MLYDISRPHKSECVSVGHACGAAECCLGIVQLRNYNNGTFQIDGI